MTATMTKEGRESRITTSSAHSPGGSPLSVRRKEGERANETRREYIGNVSGGIRALILWGGSKHCLKYKQGGARDEGKRAVGQAKVVEETLRTMLKILSVFPSISRS